MEAASPTHSVLDDDTQSLWANVLDAEPDASAVAASAASPVTLIDSSSANDPNDDPKSSDDMTPPSDESVSDVKVPPAVTIDNSSCPASSTRNTVTLPLESSNDLADGLSLLHIQDNERPPDNAKTPTSCSQVSDYVLLEFELEGPTNATGIRKSSPNHNTQSSGYGSLSHNVNALPQHLYHRRDGPSRYNRWGRREQNRGNRDWNFHTSFNGRNMRMPPPRDVSRFTRPMPSPPLPSPSYPFSQYLPPFAPPPYGGTYMCPRYGPCFPYYAAPPRPVPYMPPIPPYGNVPAAPYSELRIKIVRQVEYYFSFENLVKDTYLREHMDQQGWVPVRLIATFPRMRELTDNVHIILDALQTSKILGIQGDKTRPRDWQPSDLQRWIIPHSYQLVDASEP